jgi:C4-dicarboxylate transporter DctM subunit
MSSVTIALGSLLLMLLLIWAGMHVAITLGVLSFIGVWLIRDDVTVAANLLAQAASDSVASHVFGVVPLFVLTGFLVAHADVGKDAFEVAQPGLPPHPRRARGGHRGGQCGVRGHHRHLDRLGRSVHPRGGAADAAIRLPAALRGGVVAGSSVLGMLIPPSLLMILYGFLSNQSVGDLFTAGILPGLLLALAYALLILLMAHLRPEMVYLKAPTGQEDDQPLMPLMPLMPLGEMLRKLLPVVLLIGSVLGGIYAGLFTATEAGAVGAAMALAVALLRRKLSWRGFWGVLTETGHVTVAVSFLIICANIYTRMLAMSGTPSSTCRSTWKTTSSPTRRLRAEDPVLHHENTFEQIAPFFPGLKKEDLPDGEGWAVELVQLSTHNGTHLDAPYHFHSTMDKALGDKSRPSPSTRCRWTGASSPA